MRTRTHRHRNSQKRYYIPGALYFLTTNTHQRFPWFAEDIFSKLFVEELLFCQRLKNFTLYGYKVNPDHVHILIRPGDDFSYSEIMRSLKTNFSRNINKIILQNYPKVDSPLVDMHAGAFSINAKAFSMNARAFSMKARAFSMKAGSRDPAFIENVSTVGMNERIEKHIHEYQKKYSKTKRFQKFKWQASFHDHIIRDARDFNNHIRYLEKQWIKHDLGENKWLWVSGGYPEGVIFNGRLM